MENEIEAYCYITNNIGCSKLGNDGEFYFSGRGRMLDTTQSNAIGKALSTEQQLKVIIVIDSKA
jgi:hypothetical protein